MKIRTSSRACCPNANSLSRRLLLLLVVCAGTGLLSPALAGSVLGLIQTIDGRAWQGDIQLVPPAALSVRTPSASPVLVEVTNLLRLSFQTGASEFSGTNGEAFLATASLTPGELPPPWQSMDIGELEGAGRASWQNGVLQMESFRGKGRAWRDAFHFVYQVMKGDGEIMARVATLEDHAKRGWSKRPAAGLLMRADISDAAASALIAMRAGGGCVFRCWSGKRGRPFEEDTAALGAPHWIKLKRLGSRFSGYRSYDGVRWRLVSGEDFEMPEMVYVGLVLCSRRAQLPEQTTFDHVSLHGLTPMVPFVPQIVLRDGTLITDPFVSMDQTVAKFSPRRQMLTVLTRDVAAVLFQALPLGQALPPDRQGVWLENGDFLDSLFQRVAEGRLEMDSVLFGQRSFDVRTGVRAVLLRNVLSQAAPYEVRMVDGSVLRVSTLEIEPEAIALRVPLAGDLTVPLPEVVEISRVASVADRR